MSHKHTLNKSAMKRCGLEIKTILENCFKLENGQLSPSEYKMFWFQIGDKNNETTEFVALVLARLIEELDKKASISSKKTISPDDIKASAEAMQPGVLQSLANTVAFACTSLTMNAKDNRIVTSLKKWEELDKSKKISTLHPSATAALRLLIQAKDGADTLSYILTAATTFPAPTSLTRQDTLLEADACFLFDYLKRMAEKDSNTRLHLTQLIANRLLSCSQNAKQEGIMNVVMSSLWLIKFCLSVGPAEAAWLMTILPGLRSLLLWPKPVGSLALEVIKLAKREIHCPGAIMRAMLDSEAQTMRLADKGSEPQRAVYYIWEKENTNSRAIASTMELRARPRTDGGAGLSTSTQAMVILNLLAEHGGASEADFEAMSSCSPTQVAEMHNKVCKMLAQGASLPNDKALALRLQELGAIKREFLATSGGTGCDLAPAKAPFLPTFPALAPLSVPVSLLCYDKGEAHKSRQSAPRDVSVLHGSPLQEELDAILASHKGTVRLVLAGGNRLLHSFLCAYMRIEQLTPEKLEGQTLQLFTAPWAPNDLASFLAKHDPLYLRHIYIPFRALPLVTPSTQAPDVLEDTEDEDDANPVNNPGQFMRDAMKMYIRFSSHSLSVNVYVVEAWTASAPDKFEPTRRRDKRGEPDATIPFISRVQIGFNAAEDWDSRPSNTSFTSDLKLAFERLDGLGGVLSERGDKSTSGSVGRHVEDISSYNWLTISNLPSPEDAVQAAHPAVPYLLLRCSCLDERITNYPILSAAQHVGVVEVTADKTSKFGILIDGVQYGPFRHIRVSRAMKEAEGSQVQLRVASFIPLDAPRIKDALDKRV